MIPALLSSERYGQCEPGSSVSKHERFARRSSRWYPYYTRRYPAPQGPSRSAWDRHAVCGIMLWTLPIPACVCGILHYTRGRYPYGGRDDSRGNGELDGS